MTEENSFLFAEYAKPVAKRGKNRRLRLVLILCYVLFAAAYALLFVSINIPQVIAVLPIFVWMFVYFTWGIVNYECCVRVASGKVTLLKLRGKKEKEIFAFDAKALLFALPYHQEGKEKIKNETFTKTVDLRADPMADGYVAVLPTEEGKTLIRFECTLAVASAMRYYNKEVNADKNFFTV